MAGRIPEQFIDEVRNSVDIVDVISQYVSLEKKGKDYLGLCPSTKKNAIFLLLVKVSSFLSALDAAKAEMYLSF